MAEAEAEAAFLNSMRAMNENAGSYDVAGGGSEQQIDSSSSDEYDPAQDMLDIPLSSGSKMSDSVSSANVRENDVPLPVSTHSEFLTAVNGVISTPTANHISLPQSQGTNRGSRREVASEAPLDAIHPVNDLSKLEETSKAPDQPLILQKSFADPVREDISAHTNNQDPNGSNRIPDAAADTALNTDVIKARAVTPSRNESHANPLQALSSLQTDQPNPSSAVDSPSSAAPKARLPHDKVGLLEDRIKEDDRGDMEAWLSLLGEHRRRGKLDEVRRVYERFFAVFPSAVYLTSTII